MTLPHIWIRWHASEIPQYLNYLEFCLACIYLESRLAGQHPPSYQDPFQLPRKWEKANTNKKGKGGRTDGIQIEIIIECISSYHLFINPKSPPKPGKAIVSQCEKSHSWSYNCYSWFSWIYTTFNCSTRTIWNSLKCHQWKFGTDLNDGAPQCILIYMLPTPEPEKP